MSPKTSSINGQKKKALKLFSHPPAIRVQSHEEVSQVLTDLRLILKGNLPSVSMATGAWHCSHLRTEIQSLNSKLWRIIIGAKNSIVLMILFSISKEIYFLHIHLTDS